MKLLTIFYDPDCGLCCRFRDWLQGQGLWVGVEFVGYRTAEAERRFPGIRGIGAERECVVLADDGRWWQGEDAWLVCLWATREYRLWSHRLAKPSLKPMVGSVVHLISGHRLTLSRLMRLRSAADLAEALAGVRPECGDGNCALPTIPAAGASMITK